MANEKDEEGQGGIEEEDQPSGVARDAQNRTIDISEDMERRFAEEVEREISERDRSQVEEELRLWLDRQEMVKEDLLSILHEVAGEKPAAKSEEDDRREKLKVKIQELEGQGWDVSALKAVIDKDMETVWNTFVSFMDGIQMIEEAKAIIATLPKDVFEVEIAAVENKMKDPSKAHEILKIAKLLKKKSDWRYRSEDSVRMVLETKLKDWQMKGYNVVELENLMKSEEDIGILENAFREFENGIKEFEALRQELDSIPNIQDFKDEYAAIKALMNDPSNAHTVADMVKELKVKARKEKKRKEYRAKLEKWKEDGYIVERLEAVIEDDMNKVMKTFFEFERDIETLKSLESKVDALSARGCDEKAVSEIYSMLNDPSNIDVLRKKIKSLEKEMIARKEKEDGMKSATPKQPGDVREEEAEVVEVGVDEGSERGGGAVIEEGQDEVGPETVPEVKVGEDAQAGAEAEVSEVIEEEGGFEEFEPIPEVEEAEDTGGEGEAGVLKDKLSEYVAQGVDVTFIKQMIDSGNIDEAKRWLDTLPNVIKDIEEMKRALQGIGDDGLNDKAKELLKDIDNLPNYAENKLRYTELMDGMVGEKEKKVDAIIAKMHEMLKKWAEIGVDVSNQEDMLALFEDEFNGWKSGSRSLSELDEIVKGDLDIVWTEFKDMDEKMTAMSELKSQLEDLQGKVPEDRIVELGAKLENLDELDSVRAEIEGLSSGLEEGAAIKGPERESGGVPKEYIEKISVWEADGFDMSSLKEVLPDMDVDEIDELMEDYEIRILEIKRLLKDLEALAAAKAGVGDDPLLSKIRDKSTDPDNLEEITELYNNLKERYSKAGVESGEVEEGGAEDIESVLKAGNKAYHSGDYAKAIEYFDRVLALDPNHKKALFYKKRSEIALKSAGSKKIAGKGVVAEGQTKTSSVGPKPVKKGTGVKKPKKVAKGKVKVIPELDKISPDPNCNVCNGTGKCASCKGTGQCYWCHGSGKCVDCNGTGKIGNETCTSCGGTGVCDWCGGSGVCYWCKGTGKCDKCILPKAEEMGIKLD